MMSIRVFAARLLGLFGGRRRESDLEAEIREHLAFLTEEHIRRGLSPDDARAAAARQFGGVDQVREAHRDQRRLPGVDTFLQDVRHGLRILKKNPAFSLIAILTLALGIGATSVVFSFVTAVLTAAAPVGGMDRLVAVWSHNRTQGEPKTVVTPQDYVEWRSRQRSFERFAAQRGGAVNLGGIDQPVRATAAFVTSDYFDVMGQHPALGRAFRRDDEQPGAPPVAILSQRFWRDRFEASRDAIGRDVLLDGTPAVIVGVLPPNDFSPEVILPLVVDPRSPAHTEHSLFVWARLREGVTLKQAATDMAAIGSQLERELPDTHRGWGVNTRPLQEEFVGPQARLVFALLAAAAGAVLLIGCANIANLLLARGVSRSRELAVRSAMGASRLRLVRQLLVENLVLGLAGAAAGLLVAGWGLGLLRSAVGLESSIMERAVVDHRVLAFAAAAAVASTLVFGLFPALRSTRHAAVDGLRQGSRTTDGGRARRLGSVLVASEVGTAVLFLVLAVLLMRSLAALQHIEPGFDSRNLLTMRVSLPEVRYATAASVAGFYEEVVQRLRATGGVVSAGAGVRVPAAGSRFNPNRALVIQGRPAAPDETRFAADLTVTPGYLESLRIPLRAGRPLDGRDAADAPLVVVVSEMMVRRYWGSAQDKALGARIRLGDEPGPDDWRTVVGIVGDVRNDDIDAPPLPHVYVPLAQRPSREMTIVLRTVDEPTAHAGDARAAVAAIDANQPVYEVKTMARILEDDLRQSVVLLGILGIFAGVALALAAIGIYGVVSHSVAERTREMGVRIALGATGGQVLRLVVREGLGPVAAGLALGLATSLGLSRLIVSLLYGVTPTDPATYGSAALILTAVALAACAVPARRATRVAPLEALRAE